MSWPIYELESSSSNPGEPQSVQDPYDTILGKMREAARRSRRRSARSRSASNAQRAGAVLRFLHHRPGPSQRHLIKGDRRGGKA
jgi:hypothetical protein